MEGSKECQIALCCEYCGERNVDFLCSCVKRICENCLGKHIKANPAHFASTYAGGPVSTKIACQKHSGEICILFCKNCSEPVCTVCSKIEHEGHNFLFLKNHLSSQRTLMEKELQRIDEEFKNTYVKLASDNEQTFSDVPAKYSAIRQEVEQAGRVLQKKVEETVKKLKMQIEAMEMEHLDCLTDNKIKMEKVIENIEETKYEISRQMADPKKLATYTVMTYPFEHCPDLMERILPVFKRSENDFNCSEFLGALTPSKKATISKLQEEKLDRENGHEMMKYIKLLGYANQIQKIDTVYGYIFDLLVSMNDNILVCGTYRIKKSFTIRVLDFCGKEIMSIPVQIQPNYLSQADDETIFYTSDSKQGVHRIKNGATETIAFDNIWKPKGLACRISDIIVPEHNETKSLGRLSIYTSDGEMR
ncbi:uncharacterized protein LOC133203977 [Saccostrea echinata]|uniref:uncharacterized protein LOC133203977 n=1 Tax=Saccostrea echinata TaxID=191078 RepID=UPI002A82A394|nr:uncharacterized protein LOC133203977 [Saccostrea echinata]